MVYQIFIESVKTVEYRLAELLDQLGMLIYIYFIK